MFLLMLYIFRSVSGRAVENGKRRLGGYDHVVKKSKTVNYLRGKSLLLSQI